MTLRFDLVASGPLIFFVVGDAVVDPRPGPNTRTRSVAILGERGEQVLQPDFAVGSRRP